MFRALIGSCVLVYSAVVAAQECQPAGSALCAQRRVEASYARANAELNAEYKRVITRLPKAKRAELRTAQRAWILERDSSCLEQAKREWGGQCNTTWCVNAERQCQTEQTERRTEQLHKEGDKQ
jgi:uncharacterized protein YecT (DUF1311 family)